jgi:DNA-binding HxlR family transcriptional regulator
MQKKNFEFPPVMKYAVKGLDNKLRWKILETIITNGSMSYTKLMKELKIENKGILTFHLETLSKSALIERYEDLSVGTRDRSFYDISPIGKDIINGLISALAPQPSFEGFDKKLFNTAATIFDRNVDYQTPIISNEPYPMKLPQITTT